MIIPIGMLKATMRDGYGRESVCLINPLEIEFIIGFYDRTMVHLISGRNVDVLEPPKVLEEAWTSLMQHVIDEKGLEEPMPYAEEGGAK